MPRQARKKSQTGIYHIILRGINRERIFNDNADKSRFFEILQRYKKISNFELYGYCFMDNHIHILLKETTEPLHQILKRLSGSYVYWYNSKYDRCGHLFQERFKSEVVEDDVYFLTVLRYIHQNPLQAGLVKKLSDFKWSSLNEYLERPIITDVDFALKMFSTNRKKAIEQFRTFTIKRNDDCCLDMDEKTKVTDDQLKSLLQENNISGVEELLRLEKSTRNRILKRLKSIDGVTTRQLSRITGISKSLISRL